MKGHDRHYLVWRVKSEDPFPPCPLTPCPLPPSDEVRAASFSSDSQSVRGHREGQHAVSLPHLGLLQLGQSGSPGDDLLRQEEYQGRRGREAHRQRETSEAFC